MEVVVDVDQNDAGAEDERRPKVSKIVCNGPEADSLCYMRREFHAGSTSINGRLPNEDSADLRFPNSKCIVFIIIQCGAPVQGTSVHAANMKENL